MQQQEQWVVFDMDEVAFNLRDKMQKVLHEMTGIDVHWSQWKTHDAVVDIYGLEKFPVKEMMEAQVLELSDLEDGFIEAVQHFRESGFNVAAATARGWHPRGADITRERFDDHGINIDHIEVVPITGTKCQALRNIGNVRYFVDDNPLHLEKALDNPVVYQPIIMDRPWNQEVSGMPRVYSLDEMVEFISRHEQELRQKKTSRHNSDLSLG